MIEKQQQLTFNKGITNIPSDAICGDGELSSLVGLTSENGELKPIQDPSAVTGVPPNKKILIVHDGRYLYQDNQYIIKYYSGGTTGIVASFHGTYKAITTIGNTVIISTDKEIHYALWTNPSNSVNYVDLGTKMPEPEVDLRLGGNGYIEKDEFSLEGMIYNQDFYCYITFGQENAYNDAIIGSYYKLLRSLHQKKMFANPIVARTAVELYDGSYVLHSSPIVLLPLFSDDTDNDPVKTFAEIRTSPSRINFRLFGQKLYYKMSADFTGWEDIIKNVVLFVSKEIPVFDTTKEAIIDHYDSLLNTHLGWYIAGTSACQLHYYTPNITAGMTLYNVLQAVPANEVASNIEETSLFYKLCELGTTGTNGEFRDTSELIKTNTIENIETQPELTSDDFHTHCSLISDCMYAYNNRLHLANVSRTLFEGFNNFMPYDTEDSRTYTIVTYVRTESGEKKVSTSFTSTQAMGNYFFYPDTRAYKAEIYFEEGWTHSTFLAKTMLLKEHPYLNGAYYFAGLPDTSGGSGYAPNPTLDYPEAIPSADIYASESLKNTLTVSEVDNPFTFLPKGYVSVGNGEILGMAAVTMALSEYQHGSHPLVVFATDGVWSLTITSEGYYSRSQAVSREVCNNPSSITQVDNGIYFASSKGLMYLDTRGVRCVSTQLKGTEFDEFIDNCMIAYDYRDSLLHIYPDPSSEFVDTYVYNMKTGTFSTLQGEYKNVVNNYPDTLVQKQVNGTWNTYSLLQKPDEQDDPGASATGTYSGYMLTRPMKLENALALKSIMDVRHIHTIKLSQTTTLTFKVYASNNLDRDQNTWVQLTSLRGTPWKYYKFEYTFTGLKATDRYAGTLVVTQERRTDKLR